MNIETFATAAGFGVFGFTIVYIRELYILVP